MIRIDFKLFISDRVWFGWYNNWRDEWHWSGWWADRLWPVSRRWQGDFDKVPHPRWWLNFCSRTMGFNGGMVPGDR